MARACLVVVEGWRVWTAREKSRLALGGRCGQLEEQLLQHLPGAPALTAWEPRGPEDAQAWRPWPEITRGKVPGVLPGVEASSAGAARLQAPPFLISTRGRQLTRVRLLSLAMK